MFFDLEEQDEDPQTFAEVSNIQAMALDSINGYVLSILKSISLSYTVVCLVLTLHSNE